MFQYQVRVATGTYVDSGTKDWISLTLVGTEGESPKTLLDSWVKDFYFGADTTYKVTTKQDLGDILLIRLHKKKSLVLSDSWYCNFVKVTSPQGKTYNFPIYCWIEGSNTFEFREGTGKTVLTDPLPEKRKQELAEKQNAYTWKDYIPGIPQCLNVSSFLELDTNFQFSFTKSALFIQRAAVTVIQQRLEGYSNSRLSWRELEDIENVYRFKKNDTTVYVMNNWRKDEFFGYQFLNGLNPNVIRKCTEIPSNFPVTQEMVGKSLGDSTTLQKELEKGNIFIADYQILDGIPPGEINDQQQYIAAPLCLLHLNSQGILLPLAIQLSQTPGPEAPIFLPSDSRWDWILAKTWVRNADFLVHQAVAHLLRTHLLAETFAMATIRHLPMCHPLYKLLIPHMRYTLNINVLARQLLIGENGIFNKATSTGYQGLNELLARGTKALTYTSLCLPDDLESRGVSSLPNYYYKEDGLKVWAATESFVSNIVDFYYSNDSSVQEDFEVQTWVEEIFTKGFLGQTSTGIPSSLKTAAELKKYLTMLIFIVSSQHAAVNNGQFNYGAWMPNFPSTMRRPPPKTKDTANLEIFKATLPAINTTCSIIGSIYLLSANPGDTILLGHYTEEHFTEEKPQDFIEAFQDQLHKITKEIGKRNLSSDIDYVYLDPSQIECSVSI